VAFIGQTPARIVVVPMWSPSKEGWQPFRQAAERLANVLFVVAAGDDGKSLDQDPVYPAGLNLPNALVVTAATIESTTQPRLRLPATANWGAHTVDAVALAKNSALAAAVAAKAAAAVLSRTPELSGAELKLKLVQSSLQQLEGETPQRTRSRAIIVPLAPTVKQEPGEPAARILDKARVPERLQQPGRRNLRPQDGKAR
jgi:hypothetical protein